MNIRLKRYQNEFSHSYAFGVFATIELLTYHPKDALKILISSKGDRNEGVAKLQAISGELGIPIEQNDQTLERIAPRESHLAAGVFRKYETQLAPERDHLVLVNPADMGNLGTIARTTIGFGLDQLALIRPAADLFDPKAIRASMGAIFQLSFAYFDSFETYQAAYSRPIYSLMTNGATEIADVEFETPCALVFGSEGSGLPDSFQGIGTSIAIPQTDRIDSLNLAVAVGIALYEWSKRSEGKH